MNNRQQKAFSEAYDKIYDLNSAYGYAFNDFEDILTAKAKLEGYEFKLIRNKWKCKRIKEVSK
jgi:hypothetical protein